MGDRKDIIQGLQDTEARLKADKAAMESVISLLRADLANSDEDCRELQTKLDQHEEDITALAAQVTYWRERTAFYMRQLRKIV